MANNPQQLSFARLAAILKINSPSLLNKANGPRRMLQGLVRLLLLTLALACVSAGAYASTRGATKAGKPHGAAPLVTISLADYGAVGDGETDDGPALQNALEALADAGGGNLFVPDGHYAIITPVSVDFAGRASAITIQGTPSAGGGPPPGDYGAGLGLTAEFHIKTGAAANALTLRNLSTLLVEDLVFIGDPAVTEDARITLTVSGINDATLLRCEFYGLLSFAEGGAIVYAEASGLQIIDSAFLGCGANSGNYTPIVQIYAWKGITITGTRFVDYGTRPGYYSKTTYMSPFAWVSVGGAAPLTNLSPRRDIAMKDVLFDEGAYYALSVRPDIFTVANGGAISSLYLSQLYVNVTNLGEVGLRIQNVDNVLIENSHFGWSHNSRGAMDLAYVKNALLSEIECVLSANTIIAQPTVAELSVINSVYQTLDSQAPVTRVITTADPADGPARYVNQKYLDTLGNAPDKPGYIYWSQKRARCNDDAQCTTDEELLNYLNTNPPATFSISGRLLDADAAPVAAATVSLGGAHTIDTLTDADGGYTFAGLATAGEYTVTPNKTFYTFNASDSPPGTSSRSFVTPAGDQSADFTGTLANFSIAGRVNDMDFQSLGGVMVSLSGGPDNFEPQSATTNASGDYSFANLPAGYTYTLTPTKTYYTFDPPGKAVVLTGNMVNVDFLGTPRTHSIGGNVSDGSDPLADASVSLTGSANRNTSTDADGNFSFDGLLAGGDYTVTVTKKHYTFASQSVNNLLGDWTGAFTGKLLRYTITGYAATGSNGLGGVTVTLGGDQSAMVLTTSSGGYSFTVDAGGNYTVSAAKTGYDFAPPLVVFNDLDQNVYPNFYGTPFPSLLTQGDTNRAVAFNSITMLTEPFDLSTTPLDFGPDHTTRLVLFAVNVPDDKSLITAKAEDALGNVYSLNVEFAGGMPGAGDTKQINLRLDGQLAPGGIKISITVGNQTSNTVLVHLNAE